MEFLVTLVQLSFLLRVIWQNVEGLAKKPTSGTLDTIWEVTGTKLPVLPVPPGHPVSKQNADVWFPDTVTFWPLPPLSEADTHTGALVDDMPDLEPLQDMPTDKDIQYALCWTLKIQKRQSNSAYTVEEHTSKRS